MPEGCGDIRGLLVDLDGTLYVGNELLAGVKEALARLTDAGIALRYLTNTTSKPRSVIVDHLRGLGVEVDPEHVFTAPLVARSFLLKRGLKRCHFLLREPVLADLEGIEAVDDAPQAVVVGDLGDSFSYSALNRAFRFVLDGADFLTLARNRYYRAADGLRLDVGAMVAALEFATRREAELIGKPAAEFFLSAVEALGLRPGEVAAIGDDLESDVGGAQDAGLAGVMVRTGKYRAEEMESSPVKPDHVIDSFADLPDLLGI